MLPSLLLCVILALENVRRCERLIEKSHRLDYGIHIYAFIVESDARYG